MLQTWSLYKSAELLKTFKAESLSTAVKVCGIFSDATIWGNEEGCHQWFIKDVRSFAYELVECQ